MSVNSDDARRLYLELAEHTSMIGAYSFATGADLGRLRLGERTSELAQVFEAILDEPKPEEERGRLVFKVPSPWHAVIHLLANNRGWLSGENGAGNQMALLYRGQRDSTWPLTPSIYREGVNFKTESRVVYAFVDLVERFFRSQFQTATDIISPSLMLLSDDLGPPRPKVIHVGTAQHFGIRTPLLDFTLDPSVAVWFACTNSKGDGSEEASVFALPNRIGMVTGAAILLPHPYIRRLYRQRGVFVEPVNPRGLRQMCVEVRFPPDPSFEVVRDDLDRPDLLPEDDWWLMMVGLARRLVAMNLDSKLLNLKREGQWELYSFLMDECNLTSGEEQALLTPAFMYMEAKQNILIESTNNLLQMLIGFTTALRGNDTPRVSRNAMRHCVSGSGTTLAAMLPLLLARLHRLPQHAVLRIVGESMLGALRTELEKQDFPVLGNGWMPHW